MKELANIIDSSAGYISEIERGVKKPGSNFIVSLKRNFESLDLNKLFNIKDENDPVLENLILESKEKEYPESQNSKKEHALINLIERIKEGPWSARRKVKLMEAVFSATEMDLDRD